MKNVFSYAFSLTLVVLAGANSSLNASGVSVLPSRFPSLPEGVTSFGAEVMGDYLYVYGGHVGEAHAYSAETTLGDFRRLNLKNAEDWETLSPGSRSQGARLLSYQGAIYRVGGLQPRKESDGSVGLYSLREFARYDVAAGEWSSMPSMPDGRSSHEATVLGSRVYVGGGWKMEGEAGGKFWYDKMFVFDLARPDAGWKTVDQPFQRRAVSSDTAGGKVYFIGGMDTENDTSREVNIFDPDTGMWSEGPMIPSGPMQGFGSAACALDGKLLVSAYSATVITPNAAGDGWDTIGKLAQRRFFHRIVPLPHGELLAIAGASRRDGHLADLEVIELGTN